METHQPDQYYRQRASPGGLLISEATNISPESCGYHHAPGIWSDAQVEGWKKCCDAVHEKGGLIFCQLWHIGRVAHSSWASHPLLAEMAKQGYSMPPVSASDVAKKGNTRNIFPEGTKGPNEAPRPLETSEISRLVADYVHAAECCKRAGFDGVEIHSAHGYLVSKQAFSILQIVYILSYMHSLIIRLPKTRTTDRSVFELRHEQAHRSVRR